MTPPTVTEILAPFRLSGSPAVASCNTGKPASAKPDPTTTKILLGAIPELGTPAGMPLGLLTIALMVGGPELPDPGPAATPKVVNWTVREGEVGAVTMTL